MRFAVYSPSPLSGLIDQLRHNIWSISPEKAFENIDEDKDGIISPEEFKKGLDRLGLSGLSLEQVKGIANAFGADKKGNIRVEHFIDFASDAQGATKSHLQVIQDNLKELVKKAAKKGVGLEESFKHFDKNNDGKISKREFKTAMNQLASAIGGRLTPKEMRKLFYMFDSENEGSINYGSFFDFFKEDAPEAYSRSARDLYSKHTRDIDAVDENYLQKKAYAVTREAARHEHSIAFYFERYDRFPRKSRISSSGFERALDASGFFFSPSEIRWINAKFQAQGGGVNYMKFIYWATPESVQGDIVAQQIRSVVHEAERRGKPVPDVRNIFGRLDKNQNGLITQAALRTGLTNINVMLRPNELDVLIRKYRSGSDSIDYPSFIEEVFGLKPLGGTSKPRASDREKSSKQSPKRPSAVAQSVAEKAMDKLRKLVRLASKRGSDPKIAFEHFDTALKGTISRHQFRQGLRSLDITLLDDEMTAMMQMFGKGGGKSSSDSRIDYGAFLSAVAPKRLSSLRMDVDQAIEKLRKLVTARARVKDLKDPFLHFDAERQGHFSPAQLQSGLHMLKIKIGAEKTQLVFEALDMNADGKVDFDDWREFFEPGGTHARDSSNSTDSIFIKLRREVRKSWHSGADYRSIFERYDQKFSGAISSSDFRQALKDLGFNLSSSEIRELSKRFDYEDRGTVHYLAFLRSVSPSRRRSRVSVSNDIYRAADRLRSMVRSRAHSHGGNLRDPFKHFVSRGNSFDLQDFEEGLRKLNFSKKLGQRGIADLFDMIDASKNGKVRYSEFAMFVSGSRYTDAEDKLRMLITRAARDWDGGRNLKKAFRRLDTRDDGYITARDFRDAMRDAGFDLTKREAEDLVLRFDTNGDDRVSYREFVNFVEDRMRLYGDMGDVVDRVQKKLMRESRGENPWRIFHDMDRDGNGVLDRREFGKGLRELGIDLSANELDKVIQYFDYNGSGFIGYDNFADAVEGRTATSRHLSASRRPSVSLTRTFDRLRTMVKDRARDGRYDLRRPFKHFDRHDRGTISRRDFEDGLRKLDFDLTRSDVNDLIDYFDLNGDGQISFTEFADTIEGSGQLSRITERTEESSRYSSSSSSRSENVFAKIRRSVRKSWRDGTDYRSTFEDYDRKFNGYISSSDFKRAIKDIGLENLTSSDISVLMDRFDPKNRDKVDYIAFLREVAPSRRRSQTSSSSKIEKAADQLRMMIRQRAVAMKGNLRDPFRHFAQRRSKFDIRDFEEGMMKLEFRLSKRECEDVFNMIDIRRTGKVRFSDFAVFVSGSRYTDAEDKLRMLITRAARDWDGGRNLKKAFRRLDTRDDGYITARDFRDAMRDAGFDLTKREAEDLVLRFDTNGDDRVSYREFVNFVEDRMRLYGDMGDVVDRVQKKLMRESRGENPWRIFHDMDRDGNGVLDRREFGKGLRDFGIDLGQRDLDRVMDYFDYDKTGYIGYYNFVDMIDGRSDRSTSGSTSNARDMPQAVRNLRDRISGSRNADNNWEDMIRDLDVRRGIARTSEFSRTIQREFQLDRRDAEDIARFFEDAADEVDVRKAKDLLLGSRSDSSSTSRKEPRVPSELREVVDELRDLVQSRRPDEEDYRRFFDKFDRDHSGEIDEDEFQRALRKLGFRLTSRQAEELVNAYGSSAGRLKYYDFLRLLEPSGKRIDKLVQRMSRIIEDERADLLAVFRRFDRRDRGFLSRHDFADGMKELGIFDLSDSDIRRVMDRFDTDGDGRIDYREFERSLRSSKSNRRDSDLDRTRSSVPTVMTDISFSGKPSKRDLRSDEAIMIEVLALHLKDRMNDKLQRDNARVQVTYNFLERRSHRTEALRPERGNRPINFRFAKTFPIEQRGSEAYDVVKDIISGSRRDAEIEFIVESTERGGRDKVEGTCVIDLQQILRDGNDRDYTPSKMVRIPDVGEVEISIRAADCLARVANRSGNSRSLRSSRNYDRDDYRSSRDDHRRRDGRRY